MKRLFFICGMFLLALSSCKEPQEQIFLLDANGWLPSNQTALNAVLQTYGKTSSTYVSDPKPYAVFELNNVVLLGDITRALLAHQIEQLSFAFSPSELSELLDEKLPNTQETTAIKADVVADYTYLYETYSGFWSGGAVSLANTRLTTQYLDFRAKMGVLHTLMGTASDWFLTGMESAQIQKLTLQVMDKALTLPLTLQTWTSPDELPGEAGRVSYSFCAGIRVSVEMKDLLAKLLENGIDVYLCTYVPLDVVQVIATNSAYGLNLPADHIISHADLSKIEMISSKIASMHKGWGPLLIAGCADDDYECMLQYPDMSRGLLVNHGNAGRLGTLVDHPRFLIQGVDENTGTFRASTKTILLGQTQERAINE